MKKMLLTFAAVAALACLADTITHDDLAPVRPAGNSNYYWNTASRPTTTLNVVSISIGAVPAANFVSAPTTNALAQIETRSIARDASQGSNRTAAPLSLSVSFK